MLLNQLKTATAIVLVSLAVSLSAAIGVATLPAWGQDQKEPAKRQQSQPPAAQDQKPKAGHIFLFRQHNPNPNLPAVGENEPHLAMVSPDGKEDTWLTKNLTSAAQPSHCTSVAVSPDGRWVAYGVRPKEVTANQFGQYEISVKALNTQKPGESLGVLGDWWCWSPDSRALVITGLDATVFSHRIIDLKTKSAKPLKLPAVKGNDGVPRGHLITDWSRDGKWFLTTVMPRTMIEPDMYLVKCDGSETKMIGTGLGGKFSPDGRKVLYLDLALKGEAPDIHLELIDVKTGKRQRLSQETNGTLVGGYCWSPDGRKIAYVWQRNRASGDKEYEFFLMVMDADGQNRTVVLSQKTSDNYVPFGSPDWR